MPDGETVRALKATFDRCSPPERRLLLRELGLIAAVRRAILGRRADVLLSFIDATNVRVLLAAEGLGVPVIVSERSDPVRNTLADGMMRLRRRVYPRAACVVAQQPWRWRRSSAAPWATGCESSTTRWCGRRSRHRSQPQSRYWKQRARSRPAGRWWPWAGSATRRVSIS